MKAFIALLVLIAPAFALSEPVENNVLLSCSSKTNSLEIRQTDGAVTFEVTYRDRGEVQVDDEYAYSGMTSETNVVYLDSAKGSVTRDKTVYVRLSDSQKTEIKIYPREYSDTEYAVQFVTVSGNDRITQRLVGSLYAVFGQSYSRCE